MEHEPKHPWKLFLLLYSIREPGIQIPLVEIAFANNCYYKPRTEGMFTRIERWTSKNGSETKWRITTKENTTTLFGWTSNSRITNPENKTKIFEWLPEFVFDEKGNCAHYIYQKENSIGVDLSLLMAPPHLGKLIDGMSMVADFVLPPPTSVKSENTS